MRDELRKYSVRLLPFLFEYGPAFIRRDRKCVAYGRGLFE